MREAAEIHTLAPNKQKPCYREPGRRVIRYRTFALAHFLVFFGPRFQNERGS
jgi:hypothetical protein